MRRSPVFPIIMASLLAATSADADVITEPIIRLGESTGSFIWGVAPNRLVQDWSMRSNSLGYFYGSNRQGSNADVYVFQGLTDVTSITDASVFPYSTEVVSAGAGDSVFFRGENGYYGAWRIDDMYPSGQQRIPWTYLDGEAFYQTDGTASFVPEPASGCLLLLGVLWATRRRR